jgi:hypothetical protein
MDQSLLQIIKKAAEEERPPTVAVDLDGTLAKMYTNFDPKKIEDPRPGAQEALEKFRDKGFRIIVWTVRGDKKLIREWLKEHEIPYDYINENPDQPPGSSDKIYSDVYLDDRGVSAARASWNTLESQVSRRLTAGSA